MVGVKHKIDGNACVYCGQCLIACPFDAIEQMSFVDEVERVLDAKEKFCVAQPSPALRVSLCEEFGGAPGALETSQMVNALKQLGFVVYDGNNAADQTIMEEATEFVLKVRYWLLGERSERVNEMEKYPLPHFTSCCPAWVKNMETFAADLIPHVSTSKSPLQMGGALAKTWAAKYIWKKDPRDIYFVTTTPCTAKIFEASRPEMNVGWRWSIEQGLISKDTPSFQDIDAYLTARDVAELLRRKGINPLILPKSYVRDPLETYTAGGAIFGTSGGVMEAALRVAYFQLAGEPLKDPNIKVVRRLNHELVEATIPMPVKSLGGKVIEVKVCVVNGAIRGLEKVINEVRVNKSKYHFIEVMNCPGGCINGGGQPVQSVGTAWLNPMLPLPIEF